MSDNRGPGREGTRPRQRDGGAGQKSNPLAGRGAVRSSGSGAPGSGTDVYAAPPRTSFVASALVHLALFLFVWWTQTARPATPQFETIAIEMVSPPSAEEGEAPPEEDLTVETPEEPQPEPEPEEEPPPPPEPEEEAPPAEVEPEPEEEEPEPEPEEEAPPPTETPPPPPEEDAEPGATEADPEAETTGEDINVRMEGLRRDYPAYYNNIIRQIQRCFRWQGSEDLSATVRFYVERGGTVSDLSVVEPSGSLEFDFEAMGAVECAGTGDRLGPLPADLPFERLPVEFNFRPVGGG